jgi:predicted metal-binding membrane protein
MTSSLRLPALARTGMRLRSRPGRGGGLLLVLLVALVGFGWAALWAWSTSPAARYLDHRDLDADGLTATTVALFTAGWLLMTIAMMLPTSLPLLATFRAVVGRRPHPDRLATLVVAGYLAGWTAVGFGMFVADSGIHALVGAIPYLAAHPNMIVALTLLAAGAYQFSPLKYRCLEACRSPLLFVMSHWRAARPAREALEIGLRHAAYCVGCCWSVMLVLFALGMGNLAWMLGAGIVMAIEKNLPGGRRLGKPLGVVLLLAGGTVLSS